MLTTDECDRAKCKLIAGDLEVLGELYDTHHTEVYRTALAVTGDSSVAEDILKDCFLLLFENADSYDHAIPINKWLLKATINLVYTWANTRKTTMLWPKQLTDIPIQWRNTHSENRAEEQDDFYAALSSLDIRQRIVIVLHYYNGLSENEIATILDCRVGIVNSQLYYSRINLRRHIDTTNTQAPIIGSSIIKSINKLLVHNKPEF